MAPKRASSPVAKAKASAKRVASPAAKRAASPEPKAKAKAKAHAKGEPKAAPKAGPTSESNASSLPKPVEESSHAEARLERLDEKMQRLREHSEKAEMDALITGQEVERLRAEALSLEASEESMQSKIKELQGEIERRRKLLAEDSSKSCVNCEGPLDFDGGDVFETTTPGEYLCGTCAEKSLQVKSSKCVLCDKPFVKGESVFQDPEDDSKFACSKCVESMKNSAKSARPSKCSKCEATFGEDDPIYGSCTDDGSYLCLSCAEAEMGCMPKSCAECSGPFTDGQYVDQDGAMICVACAMKMAPVCDACGEPAFGEIAKIGGKVFHMACMKCVLCKKSITGSCSQTARGLICRPCGEEAQQLQAQVKELREKGDIAGANRIAQRLADKGFKASAERVIDTALDRTSKARIFCTFSKWDANKDSAIDEEELIAALRLIGVPDRSIQELFPHMDKNSDGKIDLQEFVDFMCGPAALEVLDLLAGLVASSPKASPVARNTLRTPYQIFTSFWAAHPETDPLEELPAELANRTT